jgi:hypothetical protein
MDPADNAAPASALEGLEGFSEAIASMPGMGNPQEPAGEPKEAAAVETGAKETAPEVEADKSAETPDPETTEDKPDPARDVNFDGFSDDHKATLERLLKAGHVTKDEVEVARKDALRQNYFSKETAKHRRAVEAWEKEVAERKDDLAVLDRIRANDRLHEAFLKAARGEGAPEESGGELVDEQKARKIVKDERAAEKASETQKAQAYAAKEEALNAIVEEQTVALSVDPAVMQGYLREIGKTLPKGVDPVLHLRPDELRDRIETRHEAAKAKAEAKALREQLTKRTLRDERTSKQSLPPPRRVAEPKVKNDWADTLAELGVADDFGNVTGSGFVGGR